ncbi:MAG: N-formylglutamate amidohydrolase [Candidatus Adiutricales bacterium]
MNLEYPLIVHVPHCSVEIPRDVRAGILLSEQDLRVELIKMTDAFTDELSDIDSRFGITIKNRYSRLVVDPERFRNDEDEIMASMGMGTVYTRTSDGRPLRNLTENEREQLLQTYFDPYHRSFEDQVERVIDRFGKCLIIDFHSFPAQPLSYELNQDKNRPDFCIGTDSFHSPEKLIEFVEECFKSVDLKVKRDTPFAGTFVPIKHYQKDKRVSSVMIEINRSLYMDEKIGEKLPVLKFYKLRNTIQTFLLETASFYRDNIL